MNKYRYRLYLGEKFLLLLIFFELLKIITLMMSAKLALPGLVKITYKITIEK